ncbi:MAG: phosphoribosylformylglycinamidine synthase [Clostridia bacterium]|nr:phosphoribosylformylglycinamidine synthase [Clostridia bacterium]
MSVFRVFVERKQDNRIEAESVKRDLRENLMIGGLENVRLINRYYVEGIGEEIFEKAKYTIFSEPQTDVAAENIEYNKDDKIFAVEYLPGQFDQRADSCSQCIQILTQGDRPIVKTARLYILSGNITDKELESIKKYVINPVESREASFEMPFSLEERHEMPDMVPTIDGFIKMTRSDFKGFIAKYALAMDEDDVEFCVKHFRDEEKRDPTLSELRLIDSYWSDHCRHTTFLTHIDGVKIEDSFIADTYKDYIAKREEVYAGKKMKPMTLMDIGTLAAKYLKKKGILKNLDESEEINACSVKIKAEIDGEEQDWLLMFKNETHNHPTEIEPFGGAATCLGGAIRDPLSGRSYVYQAMRVTGAADPRKKVSETIPGKLPQSKITTGAANGYSSYGNQIGLATGSVNEIYHPNYVAKRLEIGAVVGAAPAENVIREVPEDGDVVILLGGRTGRDGCGGATGSSKAHTSESLVKCGAEVQKGNPPEERKLQRLFRSKEATTLIRRCNDFGAGGISVAIGELADGLDIDLSKVPKKYEGLDGTELAISESQERMAVVVRAKDAEKFMQLALGENLESTVVARVTKEKRLRMHWNGKTTVDLSREFLNSNGAEKHTEISVSKAEVADIFEVSATSHAKATAKETFTSLVEDLNVCSQRGLISRFDSSIGAGSVVMPYGGKTQSTAPQFMAAKLPVLKGETNTVSVMAYGYNPMIADKSPYHSALYAVVESVSRMVAAGVPFEDCYLTFQEYFERTNNKPERWGKPFAALLGAFKAQTELGLAAIGGKDSMSGTFENIDVPPTLVSFACAATKLQNITTPEFKAAGNNVYLITPEYDENGIVCFESLKKVYTYIHSLIADKKTKAVYTLGFGGIAEGIAKMTFGNEIGFEFAENTDVKELLKNGYGAYIVETDSMADGKLLGKTLSEAVIKLNGETICVKELKESWEAPLQKVFPTEAKGVGRDTTETFAYTERNIARPAVKVAKPRVIIPVFPGTNCEYDTARAFERAGAKAEIFVLRNINSDVLTQSIKEFAEKVNNSQILMIPGGFSGGDEPDGSGKFITAVLRNPRVKEAVTNLLENRDGLMLGICNGFQALVKSGLLPYGKIMDTMDNDSPTLTFNAIGRHQSQMVQTRISSVKSPWFANVNTGDVHTVPISHGEGRFTAPEAILRQLAASGQIATQYVDEKGNPTMDITFNPNASDYAIEGITSPDGRILGKMAHSERIGNGVAINVPGEQDQKIFLSGVEYFK